MQTIRLATRKSPLALAQANMAVDYLAKALPEVSFELVEIQTRGDTHTQWSLEKEGGTGLFTAEVERAVSEGQADIAVHSAKDMPSRDSVEMPVAGYLPRANAQDVLVIREELEKPVFIATSSPRRRAQAKPLYPTAVWSEIRGNVHTRLKKIAEGKADATFLAAAGLSRLGIIEYPGVRFEPIAINKMVPAGGQGAVALQTRKSDALRFQSLLCERTRRAVEIERRFLARLGVGCHTAFGVHWVDGDIWIYSKHLEKPVLKAFPHTEPIEIDSAIDALVEELDLKL